jgi:hypothetical protein
VLVKSTGATTAGVVGTTVTAVGVGEDVHDGAAPATAGSIDSTYGVYISGNRNNESDGLRNIANTGRTLHSDQLVDGGQRVLGRQGRLGRLRRCTALTAAVRITFISSADKVGAAGNKKPDAFLTSRAIQTNLAKQYQSQKRMNDAKSVEIEGGYTGINVNLVPVIFDDDCPKTDVFAVKNDGAEVVRADGSGLDGDGGLGRLPSQGRLDRRHEGRGMAGVVGLARGARLAASERIGRLQVRAGRHERQRLTRGMRPRGDPGALRVSSHGNLSRFITQLRQARNGRWTTISPEEGGVAGELRDIDESLRLRKSEENGIYVVYQVDEAGDESLVTTADRWSWQQLPDRVRRIRHSSYDFVKELDRLDAEAKGSGIVLVGSMWVSGGAAASFACRSDLGCRTRCSSRR